MKITLANLTDATAQQVFDQVASHLLTQKVQSLGYIEGKKPAFIEAKTTTLAPQVA